MSITRHNPVVNSGTSVYMNPQKDGWFVMYEYHLAAVEELEYDLRYEREQREGAERERDYYKKLCEDNFDMSDTVL